MSASSGTHLEEQTTGIKPRRLRLTTSIISLVCTYFFLFAGGQTFKTWLSSWNSELGSAAARIPDWRKEFVIFCAGCSAAAVHVLLERNNTDRVQPGCWSGSSLIGCQSVSICFQVGRISAPRKRTNHFTGLFLLLGFLPHRSDTAAGHDHRSPPRVVGCKQSTFTQVLYTCTALQKVFVWKQHPPRSTYVIITGWRQTELKQVTSISIW